MLDPRVHLFNPPVRTRRRSRAARAHLATPQQQGQGEARRLHARRSNPAAGGKAAARRRSTAATIPARGMGIVVADELMLLWIWAGALGAVYVQCMCSVCAACVQRV